MIKKVLSIFVLLLSIQDTHEYERSRMLESSFCNSSSSTVRVQESMVISIPRNESVVNVELFDSSNDILNLTLIQNTSMSVNNSIIASLENVHVDVLNVFIVNETSISIRLFFEVDMIQRIEAFNI